MKSAAIAISILLSIAGCKSTPPPEKEAVLDVERVQELMALGKFEEVKLLIHSHRQSDPVIYWAMRLETADQMFINGRTEECMKEYQEFFRFYEEWERKGREHRRGQQQIAP